MIDVKSRSECNAAWDILGGLSRHRAGRPAISGGQGADCAPGGGFAPGVGVTGHVVNAGSSGGMESAYFGIGPMEGCQEYAVVLRRPACMLGFENILNLDIR